MTEVPDAAPVQPEPTPPRALSMPEFVALMAMLAATISFSLDAMLPALPQIGRDLSPDAPNAAQLVIVSFMLGMGLGTLVAGPLSDAIGRKRTMIGGSVIYCAAAAWCTVAPSLEAIVAARIVQGIGAAGPRVTVQAMVRDLYSGRDQARVGSFVMMIFTLVPAVAPMIGAVIAGAFGWRGVFWSFVVFSAISGIWLMLRQPETLPPARRRPLSPTRMWAAMTEVLSHDNVRRSIALQTLVFGILFATVTSVQGVYDITFDRAESFPVWFGLVALLSGGASFLNARLVMRLGMPVLIRSGMTMQLVLSTALAVVTILGLMPEALAFPVFLIWQVGVFALAGLTMGNLTAIAMQPLGHVAGMASSVISAISTIAAVAVAAPIGLAFDGTQVPLTVGVALCAGLGLLLSRRLREA